MINFNKLAMEAIDELLKKREIENFHVATVNFNDWFIQFELSDNSDTLYWFAEKYDGENLNVDGHTLVQATNGVITTLITYIIKSIYLEVNNETR